MILNNLLTPWGEKISDKPLQEYPRPQMVRDSYINLNGWWDYCITKHDQFPFKYDGKILVPFSPESQLSGVKRFVSKKDFLFYRTYFSLPKTFNKGVILLHFGAVDSICDVYINGNSVCHHEGGYNAFSVDITNELLDVNEIIVKVVDYTDKKYYTHGKQSTHRGGMWYTPQSGIWQTVWLESVPTKYISSLKITPLYDEARVIIEAECNFNEPLTAIVYDGNKEIAKGDGKGTISISFPNGEFNSWSPENPFLYNLTVISRRDKVQSYFGMRKFSCEQYGKYTRLLLNNKPYFHNGVLDQGYWSDGLYTAPSDEAMIYDIQTMKNMGFNTLRKHIKVEPMRWYYHCDRLGMLVWQDMPSGGTAQNLLKTLYLPFFGNTNISDNNPATFSRKSADSRKMFLTEYKQMISQLYNCVSIAMWVPFNEGWGQFDASNIAELTKQLDSTRTVDHASGWHDQGGGDIYSFHVYFKPVHLKRDKHGRSACLTEFGGYSYKIIEHSFNPKKTYSYKKFSSSEDYNNGLSQLYRRDVVRLIPKGLSACIYTQLSDVEDEVNGLITYDRKIVKVDEDMMKNINKIVRYTRDWL